MFSKAPPPAAAPFGLVEIFDRTQIFGWVRASGEQVQTVNLCVNGKVVTRTVASKAIKRNLEPAGRQFRLRLYSIWSYVSTTDRLTVEIDGQPLPIYGKGAFLAPETNGRLPARRLFRRLAKGYLFSQKGRLQLSKRLDKSWQSSVFSLYWKVAALLKASFDLDLIVVYGTLLGAVREKNFIGHDHDFDVGYISRFATPQEVKSEAAEIIKALVANGFRVRIKASCFYVAHPDCGTSRIDIGRLFFDQNGEFQSAFGLAGTPAGYRRQDFGGHVHGQIGEHSVLMVDRPEAMLSCIYGEDWRTPNPGFHWRRERRRANYAARFAAAELQSLTDVVHEARTERESPAQS